MIELPFNPIIPFSTPLFRHDGSVGGIIILNFQAKSFLNRIKAISTPSATKGMLLNKEGFWLVGEKEEDEWGFMLKERSGKNMKFKYPEAWKRIQKTDKGQFYTQNYLISYRSIYPTSESQVALQGSSIASSHEGETVWKIVLLTPLEGVKSSLIKVRSTLLATYFALLLIMVVASLIYTRALLLKTKMQKALKESEVHIRSILDNTSYAVISINTKGIMKEVNPATESIFGYSEGELLGKNVSILMPEPYKSAHDGYLARYNREHTSSIFRGARELVAVRKDGTEFAMELTVCETTVADEILFTGMIHDISLRKEAQKEEKESQQRFQRALNNAPHPTIIYDETGKVLLLNKEWASVSGYNIADICEVQELLALGWSYEKEPERGKIPDGLCTLKTKNNKTRKWDFNSGFLGELHGKNIFISMAIDITEKLKTDKKLQEAIANAEAASRAKSDFLASMSHEIRTPMNAIIGMADLLESSPLQEEQKEYVEILKHSGENLLQLINDILDISKIEAGHLEMEVVDFNLYELVEKTSDIMAIRSHKKQLELACYISEKTPTFIRGDSARLQQVLVNLLSNAIKFTEEGEVILRVETLEESGDEYILQFSITDTGIGIPKEKQALIFEKFTQADTSTTRRFGGTGLGLSICRHLISKMNGELNVDSEVGEGSTFRFTAHFAASNEQNVSREKIVADRHLLQGMSALITDDSKTNLLILREALTRWGIKVDEADNGEDALALLKEKEKKGEYYDFLLLDCRMPQMDGFEVAKRSQKILGKHKEESTIMMLTSDDREGNIIKSKSAGIHHYMLKPLKRSKLLNSLLSLKGLHLDAQLDEERVTKREERAETHDLAEHILLVEDDKINQRVANKMLEKLGYQVSIAGNGQEALNMLANKENSFSLILMDVNMPVMDGYTATQEIRKRERKTKKHIPIIALTALAFKEDQERCAKAGMDGYVTKPMRAKELVDEIESVKAYHHATRSQINKPQHDENKKEEEYSFSLFSPANALKKNGGDVEFLDELLEILLEDIPSQIETIKESYNSRDFQTLEKAAHKIKGTLGNFGESLVKDQAEALEKALRNKKTEEFFECYNKLVENVTLYLKEVQTYQKGRERP